MNESVRELLSDPSCGQATEYGQKLVELFCYMSKCGRAGIERLTVNLGTPTATDKYTKLGAGFWIFVESGGSASADVTLADVRNANETRRRFALETGVLIPTPFAEAVLNVPSGLSGTMVLQLARLPVPPPNVMRTLALAGGALSAVNVSQIGGTAQTGVDVSARFAPRVFDTPTNVVVGIGSAPALAAAVGRRFLYLKNTSTAGQRISLGFGAAAVLDDGITLDTGEVKEFDALDGVTEQAINAIASAAGARLSIQTAT